MVYFTSEKLTNRITRIRDILGTCLYLVEGDEKACLLDTGDGYGNLKEYVETLTHKPVCSADSWTSGSCGRSLLF